MITTDELGELEVACEKAIAMTESYGDACKAIAKKHDIDPGALKQYVTAKVRDRLEALERRQATLAQLSMFDQGPAVGHNSGEAA